MKPIEMNETMTETLRILVADDEEKYIALYHEIFSPDSPFNQSNMVIDTTGVSRSTNFVLQVTSCNQGDEAVQLVKKALEEGTPYSVVILDVRMPPGPDGIWAAEQIRALDPYIEIVIVSAYSDYSANEIISQIPPVHKLIFIQKPFRLKDIYHATCVLCSKWQQERNLIGINKELERQVKERTDKLLKRNEQLLIEITNRKRAENTLNQSQYRFESILSNLQCTTYRSSLDKDWTMLYMSPYAYQLTGYPPSDFINNAVRTYKSIIHMEDTMYVDQIIKEAVESRKPWEIEYRICHKDGSIRWVYEKGNGIIRTDGSVEYLDGFIINITKRKQGEEALRKSEEHLQSVFRVAPTGIGVVIDRMLTQVNERMCEMTNYSAEELIGQNARMLYPSDEDYKYVGREKYKQICNHGTGTVETRLKCKDGRIIDILLSSTPMDRYDLSKGVTFTALDITEKKRAEEALKESEKKYKSMMEAMKDSVYICSQDYRVEYMNPSMIKRIGRDATGEHCFKAMQDLGKRCPWCPDDKTSANGDVELDIISPKDNRSYHISQTPIVHSDGSISKMSIWRDTTDFKKMEVQLQQAQRMEAMGTLAGGIAHDFNNILFPLLGFAEMLREDVPLDSPLQGHIDGILHAALRSKDLVKQILAFSRQGDQELKPIKLQPMVKEALKLLRASIPTTIDIQQDIDPGCGIVVADPTQIHQIVMNLATNAYHAMEEAGGRLKVTLKQVRLESDPSLHPELVSGAYVLLAVSDTGTGIEKDVMDKIFNPYFTTKKTGKGTGLGLSVVQGIVKRCNGEIGICSEPGKGTEIKVYLPIMDRRVDDIQTDRSEFIQGGTEKILIVDDEEAIVKMEQQMLERLGYRVVTRTGSVDALETFKADSDTFDLIITDMTMPKMTGVQLARKIKKIRPDIPIVLCTGFSYQVNDENSKTLGVQGYIMKPVIKREMANVIRKVLDNLKAN